MKRFALKSILIPAIAVFIAAGNVTLADSLWKDSTDSSFGAAKSKTFQPGDIVSIIVNEKSTASTDAGLTTDRRTRMEAAVDQWIKFSTADGGLSMGEANPDSNPGVNLNARMRKDNTGKTDRSAVVYDRIAASVVEVLPNGNLMLEAKKNRTINGETETLTVSGIIRSQDVGFDNTVTSEKIDQLDLVYQGEGTVGDNEKRGFLSWLLDILWPF